MFDNLFDDLEKTMIPEASDNLADFEENAIEDTLGMYDVESVRDLAESYGLDPEDYSSAEELMDAIEDEREWNDDDVDSDDYDDYDDSDDFDDFDD